MITNLYLREPVGLVLISAILGLLSQTFAAVSVRSSRAAGDGCIMDFELDTLQFGVDVDILILDRPCVICGMSDELLAFRSTHMHSILTLTANSFISIR